MALPEDSSLDNNFIFPAGPLRESLKDGLKKADLVFMMNETKNSHKKTRAIVKKYFNKEKIFHADSKYKLCGAQRKKYLAFCGIAHPSNFFATLEQLGLELVDKVSYPDHYIYTEKDIATLLKQATKLNAGLITTEKDLVKLKISHQKNFSYVKLQLEISDKESLMANIKRVSTKSVALVRRSLGVGGSNVQDECERDK